MTDWTVLLACDVCEAKRGQACYTLFSAGPEALPPRYAAVPHSSRKIAGQVVRNPQPARSAGSGAAVVARRTAKRQAGTAKSWAAVARAQGKM